MSGWEALGWAKKQRIQEIVNGKLKGKMGPKFCLIMLADYADESYTCYPKLETLARDMECSVSVISEYLRFLEERGLIRILERWNRKSGGRRSNRYQMLVLGPDTPLPEDDDWQHIRAERRAAEAAERAQQDGADEPAEDTDEDSETIPPDSGSMSDQAEHASRIPQDDEHASRIRQYEPPDSGGMNLQNLEVSNKKEVNPHLDQPPLGEPLEDQNPPGPSQSDTHVARDDDSITVDDSPSEGPDPQGGNDSNESQPKPSADAVLLDEAVENALSIRGQQWRREAVIEAMRTALGAGFTPAEVASRIVIEADNRETHSPGRLLAALRGVPTTAKTGTDKSAFVPATSPQGAPRCDKGLAHQPYPKTKCPICELEAADAASGATAPLPETLAAPAEPNGKAKTARDIAKDLAEAARQSPVRLGKQRLSGVKGPTEPVVPLGPDPLPVGQLFAQVAASRS